MGQERLTPLPTAPDSEPPPGAKHDAGKARYDLIPPAPLDLIARVLAYGAEKYSDDGWRLVPDWRRRYFSATMRHAWAWYRGEELDPESGLPHLAHAACSLLFLMGKAVEVEAEGVVTLMLWGNGTARTIRSRVEFNTSTADLAPGQRVSVRDLFDRGCTAVKIVWSDQ